jgi:hypothetical protein
VKRTSRPQNESQAVVSAAGRKPTSCHSPVSSSLRQARHARDAFSPRQGHQRGRPEADMNSSPEHPAGGSAAHGPSNPAHPRTSGQSAPRRSWRPAEGALLRRRSSRQAGCGGLRRRRGQSVEPEPSSMSCVVGRSRQAVTPVSSRRPTSRCRFATADRQGRGRGSHPGAVRAASGTRAGRRAPRIRGPPHAPP